MVEGRHRGGRDTQVVKGDRQVSDLGLGRFDDGLASFGGDDVSLETALGYLEDPVPPDTSLRASPWGTIECTDNYLHASSTVGE